jgi:dephospho-CoA kinase
MAYDYAVALTGGIATGKSTAGALLSLMGFRVIDADTIAHEVLQDHHAAIAEHFGEAVVPDGIVDRKALGAIVFGDAQKRRELEAIVHPPIQAEIERRAREQDALGKPYLIDIPLFFERNAYPIERSLVVYAPRETQLKRLMERDGLDEAAALQRLAAQEDIETKRAKATWVIDNSGDLARLQAECEQAKRSILDAFKE